MSTKEQFESVVDNYYNGMYRGDPELIRKAFHPEARLQGFMEGKAFYGLTRENFCQFVTLCRRRPTRVIPMMCVSKSWI